jgi:hypothetical protein
MHYKAFALTAVLALACTANADTILTATLSDGCGSFSQSSNAALSFDNIDCGGQAELYVGASITDFGNMTIQSVTTGDATGTVTADNDDLMKLVNVNQPANVVLNYLFTGYATGEKMANMLFTVNVDGAPVSAFACPHVDGTFFTCDESEPYHLQVTVPVAVGQQFDLDQNLTVDTGSYYDGRSTFLNLTETWDGYQIYGLDGNPIQGATMVDPPRGAVPNAPEPSTCALLLAAVGLGGIIWIKRRWPGI